MVLAVLPSLVQHDSRCSSDLLAPPCAKPKPKPPRARAAAPSGTDDPAALAPRAATKQASSTRSSSAHARVVVELHGLARRAPHMLMDSAHTHTN